jgi:hypothetical protein
MEKQTKINYSSEEKKRNNTWIITKKEEKKYKWMEMVKAEM